MFFLKHVSHSKPFTSFTTKREISRRSIFYKRPEKVSDICFEQIFSLQGGTYRNLILRNMQGDECFGMMIVMVHTSNIMYKNRTFVFYTIQMFQSLKKSENHLSLSK